METKQIILVKVFALNLNDIRNKTPESSSMALHSFTRKPIDDMLQAERVPLYVDGIYQKNFRKGSQLEWFNTVSSTLGHIIREHWVPLAAFKHTYESKVGAWVGDHPDMAKIDEMIKAEE